MRANLLDGWAVDGAPVAARRHPGGPGDLSAGPGARHFPELPVSIVGTSLIEIESRADLVKRLIAPTLETMSFMRARKDEVTSFLTQSLGHDAQIADGAYQTILTDLTRTAR